MMNGNARNKTEEAKRGHHSCSAGDDGEGAGPSHLQRGVPMTNEMSSVTASEKLGDGSDNDDDTAEGISQGQRETINNSLSDQNSASALVISASDKAGMQGIDRARIDAIIMRESANTLFMQQQRRRDQKVNEKIEQMREKLREHEISAKGDWRQQIESELEPEIEALLSGRNLRSTCVCVDMDMFFMACELLSRPDLKDKPCCVGGNMISTSNYKARKYGVRSAMAGWIGDKLVEELSNGKEKLIHVPSNFQLYREKSHLVQDVLREYDPQCRCMSLDEAFLDLGPYLSLRLSKGWSHEQITQHLVTQFGDYDAQNGDNDANINRNLSELSVAATLQNFSSRECLNAASDAISTMRQKVYEATGGLTCSAGLAPNFVVAKIASDCNKPNGQKIIGPDVEEDVLPFLRPMPTRKVPGIGRVTQKILQAFHITTVQHLYEERALVRFLFHPASAKSLLKAAMGGYGQSTTSDEEDDKANQSNVKRKGISHERTFTPGEPWHELNMRLEDIARMLSKDMKEEGIWARTISLKIKLHTFDILQRSRSMGKGEYLQEGDDLLRHAAEMLRELRREHKGNQFSLRLMGIRCSNLIDDTEKEANTRHQKVMESFLAKVSASPSGIAPKTKTSILNTSPPKGTFKAYFENNRNDNIKISTLPSFKEPEGSVVHTEEANCPICNHLFTADSQDTLNSVLNKHIDSCLNAPLVRQAVQEETKRALDTKVTSSTTSSKRRATDRGIRSTAKKQRLTEYFT